MLEGVRGLNALNKRRRIRGILREWKADVVYLLETKLENVSREVVWGLWGCQHVDWCYMGSSRASGGFLLMQDRRVVEKIECGEIYSYLLYEKY
jgi:hypothetical protein